MDNDEKNETIISLTPNDKIDTVVNTNELTGYDVLIQDLINKMRNKITGHNLAGKKYAFRKRLLEWPAIIILGFLTTSFGVQIFENNDNAILQWIKTGLSSFVIFMNILRNNLEYEKKTSAHINSAKVFNQLLLTTESKLLDNEIDDSTKKLIYKDIVMQFSTNEQYEPFIPDNIVQEVLRKRSLECKDQKVINTLINVSQQAKRHHIMNMRIDTANTDAYSDARNSYYMDIPRNINKKSDTPKLTPRTTPENQPKYSNYTPYVSRRGSAVLLRPKYNHDSAPDIEMANQLIEKPQKNQLVESTNQAQINLQQNINEISSKVIDKLGDVLSNISPALAKIGNVAGKVENMSGIMSSVIDENEVLPTIASTSQYIQDASSDSQKFLTKLQNQITSQIMEQLTNQSNNQSNQSNTDKNKPHIENKSSLPITTSPNTNVNKIYRMELAPSKIPTSTSTSTSTSTLQKRGHRRTISEGNNFKKKY
jgi:hypothetical protein